MHTLLVLPLLVAILGGEGSSSGSPAVHAEVWPTLDPRLERATRLIAGMQRLTAQVVAQCDEARRERDAARLACCSPQLQDASTLLVTAVAAARALRVVLDAGGGGVDTEVLAIDVAAERVGEVRVAVEKCIGQLAWLSEERVRVEATPVRPAPELLVPGAALPPRPAAGGGQ